MSIQQTHRITERLSHIIKLIKPGAQIDQVLDVGCGDGCITEGIAKHFKIIVNAVDVMTKLPEERIGVTYSKLSDGTTPTLLPDCSIDMVTCFVSIHHFENVSRMLSDIQRVVRPGGYLFIREHDVDPDDFNKKKYIDDVHKKYNDDLPRIYYSKKELADLLASYGFTHIGDSMYTMKNPQALYHAMFMRV
jgi:ubiquinone/menaquinone biosynthesis C-methylase UbiE